MATRKGTTNKKTAAMVRAEVTRRHEEIDFLAQIARERGLAFSRLDDDQLERKIRGETARSPYIYSQMWSNAAAPGSNVGFTLWVSNPDPDYHYPFYASIYFGLGNIFDVAQGWAGRDTAWPALSSDQSFLAAGADWTYRFNYTVPTGLLLGTYNGNSVIWQGDWHGVGVEFDRGSFDIKIL